MFRTSLDHEQQSYSLSSRIEYTLCIFFIYSISQRFAFLQSIEHLLIQLNFIQDKDYFDNLFLLCA